MEQLLRLIFLEGEKQLNAAELERVKQKLDLFDFLTPSECRDLIVTVEKLQEKLRDLIDVTISLNQRLPEDQRSSEEEERIARAYSTLYEEEDRASLEFGGSPTSILQK
jgi:hypothetical protein